MKYDPFPVPSRMGGRYMPEVKPTKDPKIEEDAVQQIMTLAIYGAVAKASEVGDDVPASIEGVVKLFKDAGLIK